MNIPPEPETTAETHVTIEDAAVTRANATLVSFKMTWLFML